MNQRQLEIDVVVHASVLLSTNIVVINVIEKCRVKVYNYTLSEIDWRRLVDICLFVASILELRFSFLALRLTCTIKSILIKEKKQLTAIRACVVTATGV